MRKLLIPLLILALVSLAPSWRDDADVVYDPWDVTFPAGSIADDGDNSITVTFPGAGGGDLLADGTVPMTANWDIGNYDITLKSLTGDGTIEGATLTEGGNAIYNATEHAWSIGDNSSGDITFTFDGDAGDDGTFIWDVTEDDFTFNEKVEINTAPANAADPVLHIQDLTDAADNLVIDFQGNNRATALDNDQAYHTYKLDDDAGGAVEIMRLYWKATDVSTGTVDGEFEVQTIKNGTLYDRFSLRETQTVFNDQNIDVNFRVESDNDPQLIFGDGGLDTVTIGSNTSLAKFGIDGDADEIQLLVQGNATQTTSLIVAENSAGTDQMTLSNAGVLNVVGSITEGGNAVYNSTETPGGSLGGTWASPTIDDLFLKLGGDVASAGTYDFGSASVVLEIPNAAAPTTDATGEMAIDTDLITQGMLQVYLASAIANVVATTDTPGDNEVPTYDAGGGTVQWEAAGAGSGAFSDAGDPIVQNTTGKDVHVGDGAGTLTGKLEVGGDADQPQVVIEGHATQTDDILIIQKDDDTEVFTVSNAGLVTTDDDIKHDDGTASDWTLENLDQDKDILIRNNDGGAAETSIQIHGDSGILTFAGQSAARGWQTTQQTNLTDNSVIKVTLDAESYDIQGEFDIATNYRFTALETGKYIVAGSIRFTSITSDDRVWAFIRKGGANETSQQYIIDDEVGDGVAHANVVDIVDLAATEYVELFCLVRGTAGAVDILNEEDDTFLAIGKIH